MMSEASWCMPVAKAGSEQNIRIGGTFQAESMPCEDDTLPCPPCLTIALQSGGMHYLVSGDPHIVAILDTVAIGSFAIIEGNHYLEGHADFINVTNIIFPETDIPQLAGEWEISRETVSTPTGDGGTRWFSTHDVNYTNYVLADDLIYKVILDQVSGYAHYSDAVPYTLERKEDGTWLLTAEGLFSSSDPVEEGIPSPVTIYRLTEDEMEWMYAANGGDEGPNYYYQHLKRHKQKEDKLPSICDEWNVLEHLAALGPDYESFSTLHFRLTTDTIINATRYVKLEQDGIYKGAMREGTNADIYYVPNNSTNEYLLYAFNAQVGDSLENLWFGANEIDRFIIKIKSATVVNIESTTPRKFTIGFEWQSIYSYAATNDTSEIMYAELVWLEGVGFQFGGPLSYECPFDCAGGPGLLTLCAYKNGEKVYADPYWNEKVGCEYNRHTLPSLCDEWNVLVSSFCWPKYSTVKYYLSTDTIINGQRYNKLTSDYYSYLNYKGAMREGTNADIYYVPAGSTNEFLLYAFNAQVGEVLNNLYLGGLEENSYAGRVEAISDGSPRVFTIRVLYPTTGMGEEPSESFSVTWIEGVGSPETPYGLAVVPSVPADIGVYTLLCAYKNGEHIYTSDLGKKYGCEYNYDPYSTPEDTIPLFIKDNPGTSTVDPADPNLIYAVLRNDMLIIRDFTGVEIFFTLSRNGSLFGPRRARRVQAQQSFTDSTSVELTEEGTYDIELTSESWNYIVVGSFDFNKTHEAVEIIPSERPAAGKLLRNGQLLIRIGDQLYTPSGVMVQ